MRKIVILGAAESGVGAAILAKKNNFEVFVSDASTIKDKYKTILENNNISYEEGQHTIERILDADEVIKSPGISNTVLIIKALKEKGISIISEIEFASRYTNSKMVCITGSNGKTTTTSLIYHIFQKAGYDVGLGGNIGKSLALQIVEEPHEWYIIELSSFQLEDMFNFRANIAVLLNITPDHLDRYDFQMQGYVDAKMRILQNQTVADHFIYWANDPIVAPELSKYNIQAQKHCFTEFEVVREQDISSCTCLKDDNIIVNERDTWQIPKTSLSLQGKHNLYNAMAAILATIAAGIDRGVIREALSDFKAVEHRMEKVAEVNEILFINDSKATNVDACYYALEAMTRPTVLILGGLDKGNDYLPLIPLIKEKCIGLVYLGADNKKLHETFDTLEIPVRDTNSMKTCFEACLELAQRGSTILLSPCCASFDLFQNMGDRGRQFKALVHSLEQ